MAYSRTNWVNGATPLNQKNMNNIEDGIEEVSGNVDGKISSALLNYLPRSEYLEAVKIGNTWNSSTTYGKLSIVLYNGDMYIAKSQSNGIVPTNSTYWAKIICSGGGGGGGGYVLPVASENTLGGVKPVTKTSSMTQAVGVDGTGRLYTAPGSGGSAQTRLVTITPSQWSSQAYSITISGLQNSDIVLIDGDNSIFDVYGVSASQSNSTITFTCTTLPQVNIQIRLAVIKATSV